MARGIAGLFVFFATFLSSVPAAGQLVEDPPTAEWASLSAPALVDEIAFLAELGAFRADPTVELILDWWEPYGEQRDFLVEELQFIDEDNENLLGLLDPEQTRLLSTATKVALGSLPAEALQRIDSGETGFLEAAPWLDALTDLIVRRGRPPLVRDPGERVVIAEVLDEVDRTGGVDLDLWFDPSTIAPPPTPAIADGGTTATVADDAPVQDGVGTADADPASVFDALADAEPSDDASLPIIPIAGGVAVAVVLVVVILFARRRRSPTPVAAAATPSGRSAGLTDVLETTRRMTAALDELEVQTIAVSESVRLTGAEAGAFVASGPAGARYSVRSIPELFSDEPITGGALGRVMETGQAVQLVSDDEPSLARLPAALAAVPVIAGGGVTGAIVVIRRATEPFDANDVRSLELLAPVTGSALRAAATHNTVVTAADRDGLTELHNRRRLDHDLDELGTVEGHEAVGFAMVDVDFFKKFNDTHGHGAGDEVLRLVARTIAENVRPEDTVYRYGGEEFSVLLRGCTDHEATEVMERVRQAVERIDLSGVVSEEPRTVTVSVGLATSGHGTPSELPEVADAALYDAKHAGRNRVVTAP